MQSCDGWKKKSEGLDAVLQSLGDSSNFLVNGFKLSSLAVDVSEYGILIELLVNEYVASRKFFVYFIQLVRSWGSIESLDHKNGNQGNKAGFSCLAS